MAQIVLEIPDDKIQALLDDFSDLFKIPEDDDPENPGAKIPRYTKEEWLAFKITQHLRDQVARSREAVAKAAIRNEDFRDDNLATGAVVRGGVSSEPIGPQPRGRRNS